MAKPMHSIFERHPLAGERVQTSTGPQPTPYHVYDGHAVLIGGTADLRAVQALLAGEHVLPVRTESGRALMAVWATDEPEAIHGAHGELQVSLYVSRRELPPVPDRPFAILRLLLEEPDARQMCHGLWNDTTEVVAFNREVLGLKARLARASFERQAGRVRFSYHDAETGEPLALGNVREQKRPSMAATTALFRTFGFGGALRAAKTDVVENRVVNPVGDVIPRNDEALTLSSSDKIVAHLYDPARDQVEITAAPYAGLGFEPEFVEHLMGFKLVYLEPERVE